MAVPGSGAPVDEVACLFLSMKLAISRRSALPVHDAKHCIIQQRVIHLLLLNLYCY